MPFAMACIAKQEPGCRGLMGKSCRTGAAALAFLALFAVSGMAAQNIPGLTPAALTASRPQPAGGAPAGVRVVQSASSVESGQEGLRLAARLEEGGGLIERPVQWRIFRLGAAMGARRLVRRVLTPVLAQRLEPGDYLVEARYGLRTARQVVTLSAGERRDVVFVLNVGALRAITTVGRASVAVAPVEHRILRRLPGGGLEPVARSRVPGEIVRLPAGRYVVESVFLNGNVRARNEVRVKPGRLHSLAVRAMAGVVEIAMEGDAWLLRARNGGWRLRGRGRARLVLAPGAYVWRAGARERVLQVRADSRLRLGGAGQQAVIP